MVDGRRGYDLAVVGAGINGAAIAREAALSGLTVLVLERHDVASGTSAASTRLIHGGLRYLEHAELGLVVESLRERERLLAHAPHLVRPLGLYLPIYRGARPRWQIRAGMLLYDVLSAGKSLPRHAMLGREALCERLPTLVREGLVGGAFYYDAQIAFPERLIVELLVDACSHGAELAVRTRVTDFLVEDGRVAGVRFERADGSGGEARAAAVVNAAGPWVDRVVAGHASGRLIGGTKGSHIVVLPFPGAPDAAVYAEAESDGRPFFVLPWNGLYLIGTTDERFDGDPGSAAIDGRERDYLVAETERLFPSAAGLAKHVCYTQAGIRPLPYVGAGETGAITRRHIVHAHDLPGLWSVIGGKLTTHRALAEDVLRALGSVLPVRHGSSPTRERPLPGALSPEERDELCAELAAELGTAQANRLCRIYGVRARAIAAIAARTEIGRAPVAPNGAVLAAELVHALEHEWAVTLEDLLLRRSMAGLGADFGLRIAEAAAGQLARLGLWDREKAALELADYRACARRHSVPGAMSPTFG